MPYPLAAARGGRVIGGGFTPPTQPAGAASQWPLTDAALYTDIIGGRNGTGHSGVSSVATLASTARAFDGTANGYISLPSCPISDINNWTIAFDVNLTTPTSGGGGGSSQTILNLAIDGSNRIRIAANEDAFQEPNLSTEIVASVDIGGSNVGVQSVSLSTDYPLCPARWDRIAVRCTAGVVTIHKSGEATDTTPNGSFSIATANNIGAKVNDGTGAMTAGLRNLIAWNRGLTDAEIRQDDKAAGYLIAGYKKRMTVVAFGASNTETISYADLSLPFFPYGFHYRNAGHGGATWADFLTNFVAWMQAKYDPNTDLCLGTFQNTNDMDGGGLSGAAAYARLQAIANPWKALGANSKYVNVGAWGYTDTGSTAVMTAHGDYDIAALADAAAAGFFRTSNIGFLDTGISGLDPADSNDGDHLRGDNPGHGHYRLIPGYVAAVQAVRVAA